MNRGEKRSFDQLEESSVAVYEYSEAELRNLKMAARNRPRFTGAVNLDYNTKIAALKASSFVVSLVSFSGEDVVTQSCGTIIEADGNTNTVMTSLNLIRRPSETRYVDNTLVDNLKVVVLSCEQKSYVAEVFCYDIHYNLLILKFKSESSLQPATLSLVDDSLGMDSSSVLRPHSVKVKPGDAVIVIARYFYEPFTYMAAPGLFRLDLFDPERYECNELFAIDCRFTRCADGSPVINLLGEVIGICYYDLDFRSPFLPMNIVYKWWIHYKNYKEFRRPLYGFEGRNMFSTFLSTLDTFLNSFPSISNGVLVEKVLAESYAESAGLREKDLIVRCDGKTVKSFLELWDFMWDKVGKVVEFEVARLDRNTLMSVSMMVGEASPDELNEWPRYDHK